MVHVSYTSGSRVTNDAIVKHAMARQLLLTPVVGALGKRWDRDAHNYAQDDGCEATLLATVCPAG